MPQIDYVKLLNVVAKRSKALGFTVNSINDKRAQIDLAFQSLKISIDDSTISSAFYIEDTIYNPINFPTFADVKTPDNIAHMLHVIAALKKRYERVVDLHQRIFGYGEKIDNLRARMKLLGVKDKSNDNPAENLTNTPTSTQHPMDEIKRRIVARLARHPVKR